MKMIYVMSEYYHIKLIILIYSRYLTVIQNASILLDRREHIYIYIFMVLFRISNRKREKIIEKTGGLMTISHVIVIFNIIFTLYQYNIPLASHNILFFNLDKILIFLSRHLDLRLGCYYLKFI